MLRVSIWLCVFTFAFAAHLPPFIRPCRKNDPKFNECVKDHAIQAIPYIVKGVKDYQVPPLDPLHIPQIALDAGNQLSIKLNDLVFKGINDIKLEDINIDLKKKHICVRTSLKTITVDGQYDIDGRILVVPIKGTGPFHLDCQDFVVDYEFTYKMMTKDGKEYVSPDISPKLTYKFGKINLKLENLFNGDKTLGDRTNEFINEHISELNEDFSGTFVQALNSVITDVMRRILPGVPYDEVYL